MLAIAAASLASARFIRCSAATEAVRSVAVPRYPVKTPLSVNSGVPLMLMVRAARLDIVEAAGQSTERPVRVQIAEPLGLGIGTNEFPQCPADGKLGGGPSTVSKLPRKRVKRSPSSISQNQSDAEAAKSRKLFSLARISRSASFLSVMSRITPMNLRPSSSVISAIASSIGKIFAGAAAGDDLALAADDPGGAGTLIAPHVAVMRTCVGGSHQDRKVLAPQLMLGIAEHHFDGAVYTFDDAALVRGDDALADIVEDGPGDRRPFLPGRGG